MPLQNTLNKSEIINIKGSQFKGKVSVNEVVDNKLRSTDRVLVLKRKEGENAKNSKGMTDNRLFTGQNKLHAIMDEQSCLWHLKYEEGVMPQVFNMEFTSFERLMRYVKDYYERRNIIIEEVID